MLRSGGPSVPKMIHGIVDIFKREHSTSVASYRDIAEQGEQRALFRWAASRQDVQTRHGLNKKPVKDVSNEFGSSWGLFRDDNPQSAKWALNVSERNRLVMYQDLIGHTQAWADLGKSKRVPSWCPFNGDCHTLTNGMGLWFDLGLQSFVNLSALGALMGMPMTMEDQTRVGVRCLFSHGFPGPKERSRSSVVRASGNGIQKHRM